MSSQQTQTYTLSDGTELSFTDSGAPPNSKDYTTILFLHGAIFNAYQFQKIHAHAHPLNLRTVLLHRRDYAGSTPYSPEEIDKLKQGDESFWERLSAQVAEFLQIFINREQIPRLVHRPNPSQNRTTSTDDIKFLLGDSNSTNPNGVGNGSSKGGVVIFGWSAGCSTVLSLLGATQNRHISHEMYKELQEYVEKCIFYDPPHFSFGYNLPPDSPGQNTLYLPWEDPEVSAEDLPKVVADWISSYYDHPCYDPVNKRLSPTANIRDLDARAKTERITVSAWTEEELEKGIEKQAAGNEVLTFLPPSQKALHTLAHRALFPQDRANNDPWFPNVEISYLAGTKSTWLCAWAEIETKKKYTEAKFSGIKGGRSRKDVNEDIRKMRFFDLDGFNHFAHWDRTEEFMQVVAEAAQSHGLGW